MEPELRPSSGDPVGGTSAGAGPREPAASDDASPAPAAPPRAGPGLESLEALFDDPSPTVWRGVRRALARRGKPARKLVARMEQSGSPRARARARRLALEADRTRVSRRLIGLALREDLCLEQGLFVLSHFGQPGLDARPYLAALDAMGAELLRRVEHMPPSLERALQLPRYLGDELGFEGREDDEPGPDDVYLHRALTKKRGLPLTLASIYQLVGRRAGIRTSLVGLPGHVVLRLSAAGQRVLIDPFQRGIELSERDCLAYLAERGLTFRPRWFQDASDHDMLERQVRNLAVCFRRRGLAREVHQLACVLRALRARREEPLGVGG